MKLLKWQELPEKMQNDEVRIYYDFLQGKKRILFWKGVFDKTAAFLLLLLLSPLFLLLAALIKIDSKGGVFFRQLRVTQYGKGFYIYKFRTMVENAESFGSQVTSSGDSRLTPLGRRIRRCRLDEIPQLINILKGEMSFVGTRPEVPRYVDQYTDEMMATLLLPAGVTSEASIYYKDEEKLLSSAAEAEEVYLAEVLPEKMKWNLTSVRNFSFFGDIKTMLKTVKAVL